MPTEWTVESRLYYLGKWEDGVAQLVRGEHGDESLTRTLQVVFWWPAHEGKEWPATVIVPDSMTDASSAWMHFEATLDIDERYRWEQLPPAPLG